MSSIPPSGVQSSASSVINVDLSEGILVPEVDAEVDVMDGDVTGAIAGFNRAPAGDEVSKKALRDQLRRTLSTRESPTGQYRHRSFASALIRCSVLISLPSVQTCLLPYGRDREIRLRMLEKSSPLTLV